MAGHPTSVMSISTKPRIVLIISRGEAVRNFLYSDTLSHLAEHAHVTLLSVVDDEKFNARFRPFVNEIVPLHEFRERKFVVRLRSLIHDAHFRWLWSEVAKNVFEAADARVSGGLQGVKHGIRKAIVGELASRPLLDALTRLDQYLSCRFSPTDEFEKLFRRLRPNLVFNCSHIHGPAGELPAKIAHRMGIPTAGFIFSWDNLTSRSRIFVPYDYYLVWHESMKRQLITLYDRIAPSNVIVTGTPQFDFHFKQEFLLSREDLCARIGLDPARPFILYTTGIDRHFPEEHRHVQAVVDILRDLPLTPKPQLVVRTYVKGTGAEMKEMAAHPPQDVFFPAVQWEEKWFTPMESDLSIYSSLIHHAAMSINAASTVTLEFLMLDKPVMNIGFDPPGSWPPNYLRWERHMRFDHFRPVAESGAVMVACSLEDMRSMLERGLRNPGEQSAARNSLMREMFGDMLDGNAGKRVAGTLLHLAGAEEAVPA